MGNDNKMNKQEEYNKLVKFNRVKENCIYCKNFVRETFDFNDVFPAWGSESLKPKFQKEVEVAHEECKKEMFEWQKNKTSVELLKDFDHNYNLNIDEEKSFDDKRSFEYGNFGFKNSFFIENSTLSGLLLNQINTITFPKEIFNFNELKYLKFSNSGINEFPYDLEKLTKLEKLYVGFNQNRPVFSCICGLNLPNLESLTLQYSYLCERRSLDGLPKLKELTLIQSSSKSVKFHQSVLPNLEILQIIQPNIEKWDLDFSTFPNLKELHLHKLDLDNVPVSICKLDF